MRFPTHGDARSDTRIDNKGNAMTSVVSFLESLASDARMARMSAMEYAEVVGEVDLPESSRSALMAKDVETLAFLQGIKTRMWCMVFSPDQKENPDIPSEDDAPASPAEEEA